MRAECWELVHLFACGVQGVGGPMRVGCGRSMCLLGVRIEGVGSWGGWEPRGLGAGLRALGWRRAWPR